MSSRKILLVEDDKDFARVAEFTLTELGYKVIGVVDNGDEAITIAEEAKPDLVLMDINIMGSMDGIETASIIRDKFDIPVIYLTARYDSATVDRAKDTEPYNYILKPFDEKSLKINIDMALDKYARDKERIHHEVLLRSILRSVEDAVIAANKKGLIIFMNSLAEKLTGIPLKIGYEQPLSKIVNLEIEESKNYHKALSDLSRSPLTAINFQDGVQLIDQSGNRHNIAGSFRSIDLLDCDLCGTMLVFQEYSSPPVINLVKASNNEMSDDLSILKNRDAFTGHDIIDVMRMITSSPKEKTSHSNFIQTFNEFEVTLNNHRLNLSSWRSKKAKDLFAHLIMEYPRSVHKEILMEFLWQDIDPDVGNRRLHHVVSELRNYLEPSKKGYKRNNYILYSHEEYKLELNSDTIVDHFTFVELARAGNRLWVKGDLDDAKLLYEEALDWKRGVFFPKYIYRTEFDDKGQLFENLEAQMRQRLDS